MLSGVFDVIWKRRIYFDFSKSVSTSNKVKFLIFPTLIYMKNIRKFFNSNKGNEDTIILPKMRIY